MENIKLRSAHIFLIGNTCNELSGPKLPSIGQVLSRFFFCIPENKMSVKQSASVTIEEVFKFWNKVRIPTRPKVKCVQKIENLYKDWHLSLIHI